MTSRQEHLERDKKKGGGKASWTMKAGEANL